MIPIGTKLRHRSKRSPSIVIKGVMGTNYIVQVVTEDEPNVELDIDALTQQYDCKDLAVAIHHESEQEAWARLSRENFDLRLQPRQLDEDEDLPPSPEQLFAEAENG